MSGRSGAGHPRPGSLGPQPLKATVPFRLASKPRPNRRDGKSAGKPRLHQLSSGMRRTMSLDAIIGPYLQGHWPKEPEVHCGPSCKDKSTQTPESWVEKSRSSRASGSHRRSASWGSAEHLREIAKLKQQLQQGSKPAASGVNDKDRQCCYPHGSCSLGATQTQPVPIPLSPLSTLVPRLRCSVEGLNQELEGMFISQSPPSQHRLLEVPDGHRAPVPLHSCSSSTQSDRTTTPLSSSSNCSSPCASPPSNTLEPLDPHQGTVEKCPLSPVSSQNEAELHQPPQISSSPGLNKSFCFQREPPEGCEKVRVWEEFSIPHHHKEAPVSSCPDPNKVNFTPHGGSAFCPVSLLKPLFPSMDLLIRSLTVSPVGNCSGPGTPATGNRGASPDPAAASAVLGDASGEALAF
ncbi:glucocorticoid-induced transcript 1 protein-like [Poeciliopsis prolifica]|uniref:glucocorticoid-induced transcript 1 protein-like n=1 Tax=Poeciliopsis prolifica TaxID=188132 RepID=UPI00241449E7|nr:glucocorticoid-induced transcript 1 protein-like [Poeciliopsis prolifica]